MEPELEPASTPASGVEVDVETVKSPEEHARWALVEMEYGQAIAGPVTSFAAAGLLSIGLWDAADHRRLVIFLTAIGAASVLRMLVIFAFRRRRLDAGSRFWERSFVATLFLACLVWGLGTWYIRPPDSPFHQALIFGFVLGMAGGTAVLYSGARIGAIVCVVAMVAPMFVWLALEPSVPHRIMAAAALILLVLCARGILVLAGFIRRSFELTEEVEAARRAAEALARTDDLTGLLNRRAFYEMGQFLLDQAIRQQRALSILLIDLDYLKELNDRHGHAAGDAALRSLAALMQLSARKSDVVGRLGGDEFAVLMPATSTEAATGLAERLRQSLSGLRIRHGGKETLLTCSMGVASSEGADALDELVHRADQALYRAKSGGRDQVVG